MTNKLFYSAVLMGTFCFHSNAQKTCNKTNKNIVDNNTISKCIVIKSKKANNPSELLNVEVSVKRTRSRFVRRKQQSEVTDVNSINSSNKLEKIREKTALVNNLELSNETIDKLPFNLIDEKPMFAKCSDASFTKQGKCFNTELTKHIQRNFKYPTKSFEKGIQGKVLVQFIINEFGEVTNIITRGPIQGDELENEAKRIIKKLPKFKSPGKFGGNTVKVKYGIPINFKIEGREATNINKKNTKDVVLDEVMNFSTVENIPLFNKCSDKPKNNQLDCFNTEMGKHIKKYFTYPEEAVDKGIEGRIYTYFIIDKKGNIVNIKTRGTHNTKLLEEASKRIIEYLPIFIPGKNTGNPVNVKYTLPINFKLN